MDYLKELYKKLGGTIRSQNLYNWNYDQNSFKELILKDYKGHKIEISEFDNLIEIEINSGPEIAFSINIPNKIFTFYTPSSINNFPYDVYFREYDNEQHLLSNKEFPNSWSPFIAKIKELKLRENEGIFFYQNVIQLALDKNRDVLLVLDDFINLLIQNVGVFNKEINEKIFKKNIPENLRPLIPLLKKWSIPDDSEREQLMEETSEKQKKKLVKTVWP